jgi:GT2 family glycosyltransferase
MKAGFILVYEPKAIVWHRHRRNYAALRKQIENNGVGYYAFLTRTALHFPEERAALARLGAWWLFHSSTRRTLLGAIRGRKVVRDLATVEFFGSWRGMCAYPVARRKAKALANGGTWNVDRIMTPRLAATPDPLAVAVRRVTVEHLTSIDDVTEYAKTRVYVSYRSEVLGHVDIANLYSPISGAWLRDAISDGLWLRLAETLTQKAAAAATAALIDNYSQGILHSNDASRAPFEVGEASVSVVIATLDRPNDLRTCLESVSAVTRPRKVQIVVVDNHPESGLTAKVVADFPQVKLVAEPRRGLSYARNSGILASCGEFIASTDDDVVVEPDWLQTLIAPFERGDVYAVTGNTLPIELETVPQQLFESYSGLGRGYERREIGSHWFKQQQGAVPTWTIGATANAAFRASAFRDPRIGLLDEVLGPGTPTGVGEDTYLFYKILKAGFTIVYEPRAVVWHRHRKTMTALRNQLFNYSKGHVAYHLHTLIHDYDTRVLSHLFKTMPRWRVKQLLRIARDEFRGKNTYPMSLVMLELWGHLLGPIGLWHASARARRLRGQAA